MKSRTRLNSGQIDQTLETPIFDLVRSIACLVLIGSLRKLQITWTGIKSQTSVKFWQDRTIHFGVTKKTTFDFVWSIARVIFNQSL